MSLRNRRLSVQSLESRQMLAGDFGHNFVVPTDVNGDGSVSPADAILIVNSLERGGVADATTQPMRCE